MRFRRELREHWRQFRREARLVMGAEGILGVLALYQFIKSIVERTGHIVLVHGRLVEQHEAIHPSWGWLCLALGIALFAEARIAHRLLGERDADPELIPFTPRQLAEYTNAIKSPEEPG